jgi:hypothetical protein
MNIAKDIIEPLWEGFIEGLRVYRDIFVVPGKALIEVLRNAMAPAELAETGKHGLKRSGGHVVVRRTSAKAMRAHLSGNR